MFPPPSICQPADVLEKDKDVIPRHSRDVPELLTFRYAPLFFGSAVTVSSHSIVTRWKPPANRNAKMIIEIPGDL
jgi:hypothetical protein